MSKTIILISGANTGIGFEIAKKLLISHSNLHVFLGSRDLENGTKAVEELTPLSQLTNTATAVQLDITSDPSISSCISTIQSTAARLDVLINNAGVAPDNKDKSPASTRTAFANAFAVNVTSTALLTDSCIPLLEAAALPRLIFVTSGLGSLARMSKNDKPRSLAKDYRPYVVSKTAMNMLAVIYMVRFKEKGWKVNLVCPGLRKTKLNDFMEGAGNAELGAVEAVRLAMDEGKVEDGGRSGGMWDWDGAEVPW